MVSPNPDYMRASSPCFSSLDDVSKHAAHTQRISESWDAVRPPVTSGFLFGIDARLFVSGLAAW